MKKEPRPDYRQLQGRHRREYREAYASPEALAWIASMSPAERERAQRLGLLEPLEDCGGSAAPDFDKDSEDDMLNRVAVVEQSFDDGLKSVVERRAAPRMTAEGWYDVFRDLKAGRECPEEAKAFLMQGGTPKLRWACICYLLGDDTCENLARSVSMTKQAFHYHVRQLQQQLGLERFTGQKSGNARKAYREIAKTNNPVKDTGEASSRHVDVTSNPGKKFSRHVNVTSNP